MNGQQIEIVKDDDPYTRVFNALIFDDNLRLQTRMVLIMMTSFRPDWDFSIRGMANIAHVTKDTMSKMLAELENAGYVKRKEQARGTAGQFAKAGYLVSRKPIFKNITDTGHKNYDTAQPCPDSSYTVEPYTKNSPQLNTKQLNTKQSSTPYSPPEGDGSVPEPELAGQPAPKTRRTRRDKSAPDHAPEAFEAFWSAYPRKDNRKKSIEAWDKLKPDKSLCRTMYSALKRQCCDPQWAEAGGKYIPMFSTWLNQRRWENQGVDLSLLQGTQPQGSSGRVKDLEVL